ncbi:MAG TPA: sigma-70 family RNA polymerase sigma factor [Flavilitoribacter sp.]|nr:sigma-70 family RNA polymerase sigma factor [Flavilitoribacter sp.]
MAAFENDRQIISALQGDNQSVDHALSWIIAAWKAPVMKLLLEKFADEPAAEDAFIEGLAAMAHNVGRGAFRGDSKLYSYLSSICVNKFLDQLKKQPARSGIEPDILEIPDFPGMNGDFESLEKEEEIRRLLNLAFDRLGEECRTILLLRAKGVKPEEIAGIVNLQYQTVKNKTHNCRREFRELAMANPVIMDKIKELI